MARLKSGDIATSLRDRVLGGEWTDSGVVPNERALSLQYGVARNTIRRAIESLVEQGLVTRHVGRGTLIADPLTPDTPDAAKDLVQIVRNLAGTSPLDIMNMRLIIEPAPRQSLLALPATLAAGLAPSTTLGKDMQLSVAGSLGHRIQGMCDPSP